MAKRPRTRDLMIVVGFALVLLAMPFEWLTPQGALYRMRADRCSVLARRYRAEESEARDRGDVAEAERRRGQAEQIEREGWAARKASWRQWKWPELKGSRPVRLPYQLPD
jgi:hypothetical protein